MSDYRGQSYQNQDFALVKDIMLFKEDVRLRLRAEFFNLWNRHIFNAQGGWGGGSFTTDINSPDFGMWNGSVTNPRNVQVGVRLVF